MTKEKRNPHPLFGEIYQPHLAVAYRDDLTTLQNRPGGGIGGQGGLEAQLSLQMGGDKLGVRGAIGQSLIRGFYSHVILNQNSDRVFLFFPRGEKDDRQENNYQTDRGQDQRWAEEETFFGGGKRGSGLFQLIDAVEYRRPQLWGGCFFGDSIDDETLETPLKFEYSEAGGAHLQMRFNPTKV